MGWGDSIPFFTRLNQFTVPSAVYEDSFSPHPYEHISPHILLLLLVVGCYYRVTCVSPIPEDPADLILVYHISMGSGIIRGCAYFTTGFVSFLSIPKRVGLAMVKNLTTESDCLGLQPVSALIV